LPIVREIKNKYVEIGNENTDTADFKLRFHERQYIYEGESKIIRNVATYCAVGYTAGWT
jgi:hypothetical protein